MLAPGSPLAFKESAQGPPLAALHHLVALHPISDVQVAMSLADIVTLAPSDKPTLLAHCARLLATLPSTDAVGPRDAFRRVEAAIESINVAGLTVGDMSKFLDGMEACIAATREGRYQLVRSIHDSTIET